MSSRLACEEACSSRCCRLPTILEYFDCVYECMRACLFNVAGEAL